ncbi:cell wall anchor protein [Sinorhizobium medicae]|uniref:cell wall anchor protein n=1 Tax=Sinorhizobium medicae TaxID=110321 RepID=UPI001296B39D|nr:cell wall anchor protein [Sinorhizobium medicae]MDX0438877.1 cell wall anchor protein [Sinorhizobium medicae]MDX0631846.1 cell wall anchor protein [Sinorhizobium medicae]MDX0716530.1 cell wall anchor protein [Sinorhizobium medicae]MDX0846184.1 cell wall anchor protein [Sinorhizobium medicae]MDX0900625.1 cell wall anchor protein [Sinorhizobium medicae]
MRSLIIASAASACLMLASCTATGSLDTAIKNSLPKTCALLETAHAAFIAASASGNIKAKTLAKEKAAYDGVRVICADPGGVTAANALVVAATAYATVSLALREAKAAE